MLAHDFQTFNVTFTNMFRMIQRAKEKTIGFFSSSEMTKTIKTGQILIILKYGNDGFLIPILFTHTHQLPKTK